MKIDISREAIILNYALAMRNWPRNSFVTVNSTTQAGELVNAEVWEFERNPDSCPTLRRVWAFTAERPDRYNQPGVMLDCRIQKVREIEKVTPEAY